MMAHRPKGVSKIAEHNHVRFAFRGPRRPCRAGQVSRYLRGGEMPEVCAFAFPVSGIGIALVPGLDSDKPPRNTEACAHSFCFSLARQPSRPKGPPRPLPRRPPRPHPPALPV